MSLNLAVDELESAAGIRYLLAKAGCKFGEQVAMFERGGFGIQMQLAGLTGDQNAPLCIEYGDVPLCMPDLAPNAQKLGRSVLACNESVDLAMIVKETLQGFRVAAVVGLIGASHQQGEMLLLGLVAREVGVDALGDLAKEGLEAGRWIELFGFMSIAKCSIMSLLRALAGILGSAARGVGVVEVNFTLGNARFEFVELSVKHADLAEITPFKGPELGAELGKLRFALRKSRANCNKLLALVEEVDIVRGLLKDDFGWHAVFSWVNF